ARRSWATVPSHRQRTPDACSPPRRYRQHFTSALTTFWDSPNSSSRGASASLMFKLRSIAARLILAITLTAAVACGVLGTFSIIQQRSLTRLALDQQLKLQYDSVMAALAYEGRAALAVADIGVSFGTQFVDSAKQRFGVDLAVYRFDGKVLTNIASSLGNSSVATPDELKSAFDGATLRRDATLNGHPAALYLGQIRNYAGHPVAVIELVKDTTEYEAAAASSQRHLIFGTAVILAGAIVLAFLLGRGLSRPLAAITAVMNRLSSGDTAVTIPGGARKDELGTMAGAVDVFRRSMIEARTMREAQEAAKQEAELEKKALQRQMADRFEVDVKSVVAAVAQAIQDMQRVAGDIMTSVNGTSERAAAAAAASEEASASVGAVAAATEELASTVAEIGRQVTHSSGVADAAVVKALQTTEMVGGLTSAGGRSGDVLRLIG